MTPHQMHIDATKIADMMATLSDYRSTLRSLHTTNFELRTQIEALRTENCKLKLQMTYLVN